MPTWVTRHQTFALLPGPLCLPASQEASRPFSPPAWPSLLHTQLKANTQYRTPGAPKR